MDMVKDNPPDVDVVKAKLGPETPLIVVVGLVVAVKYPAVA